MLTYTYVDKGKFALIEKEKPTIIDIAIFTEKAFSAKGFHIDSYSVAHIDIC